MTPSRYVLHARLFTGSLEAPDRNELRTAEGDNREALERLADTWQENGWRVWLYERLPASPGSLLVAGSPVSLHVLAEFLPRR